MAYSPKAIANYFLDVAKANGDAISPMKLQKLVYYAHGWHLGNTGKPLIDEAVEAWQYGPVIPSRYQEFKKFGSGSITARAQEFDMDTFDTLDVPHPTDPKILHFLASVWRTYGKYTGIALSTMTHANGSPWQKTWNGIKGVDIPNAMIQEHFKTAVETARARART